MKSQGGPSANTLSSKIAEALLPIVQTSFPEDVRSDFRGSSQWAELTALSGFEWTAHVCSASSTGAVLQIGATADTFLSLAEVLGLDRRKPGHRNEVLQQLKNWAMQIVEVIRRERPESEVVAGTSTWMTQIPDAGVSYLIEAECGAVKLPLAVTFSPGLLTLLGENEPSNLPLRPAAQSIPLESLGLLYSLLDMELPVTISFGRAEVPFGELLQFGPGTVVELDRSAVDPVEVRVNNQLIARGEVVAIEGNYGVRIQEVVSAQDRLLLTNNLREQAQKEEVEAL